MRTRSPTLFILALLFFCGQTLAAPLLSCCSTLSDTTAQSEGHNDHRMDMDTNPAHSMSAHHHDVQHADVTEAGLSFNPDAQCSHQCLICISLSTSLVLDAGNHFPQYKPVTPALIRVVSAPVSHSDSLFRPPNLT